MLKLIDFRFVSICYFIVMGLMGLVRQQVGRPGSGHYLSGDEAMAFGWFCLTLSGILIFLDFRARHRPKDD